MELRILIDSTRTLQARKYIEIFNRAFSNELNEIIVGAQEMHVYILEHSLNLKRSFDRETGY